MIAIKQCPACESADIDFNKKKKIWICPDCQARFDEAGKPISEESGAKSKKADQVDPRIFPSVLAFSIAEYLKEDNPRVKLWLMCETTELALRFISFVALGQAAKDGVLPEKLADECRERIETPTMGKWQGIAEAAVRHLEKRGGLREMLEPILEKNLLPLQAKGTPEKSLSALRNQLAHGGGISLSYAAKLLPSWEPKFIALLTGLAALGEIKVIVRHGDGFGILLGPNAVPTPFAPDKREAKALEAVTGRSSETAVALIRDEAFPLWPLALYGRPTQPGPEGGTDFSEAPQVYSRRGEAALAYTPIGSEETCLSEQSGEGLERFLDFFRLRRPTATVKSAFEVRGFEDDLRKESARLIGRENELETLEKAVKKSGKGLLWVTGPAGIGKSCLMARLAHTMLIEKQENEIVLPYRFRKGDDRCRRDRFLKFCLERLNAVLGPVSESSEKATEESDKSRQKSDPKPEDLFASRLRNGEGKRIVLVLDGLDEIARWDPAFVDDVILRNGDLPGVLWICAGRPEGKLPLQFGRERAKSIFSDVNGLPPMNEADIRGMIMTKIEHLARRLLENDRDERGPDGRERVRNGFIDKVAKNAMGLPLYVNLVIGDILGGRLRALDVGERLPRSLEEYYSELMRRCGVGRLQAVLTPLVGALALSREPVGIEALAALLHFGSGGTIIAGEGDTELVGEALRAVGTMVRRSVTPEGGEGYALHHDTLRQYLLEKEPDVPGIARNLYAQAARLGQWPAPLMNYLVRHGVRHLCEASSTPANLEAAANLLTSFDHLMEKTKLIDHEALVGEYELLLSMTPAMKEKLRVWRDFFRENMHVLRRGDEHWPSYKILLQLAMEHADDSPVTLASEKFIEEEKTQWAWLRSIKRNAQIMHNPCLAVLEGHSTMVFGALLFDDGRILSWSGGDNNLRIWSKEGYSLAALKSKGKGTKGALLLPGNRILSWTYGDGYMYLWDSITYTQIVVLEGHSSLIEGVQYLHNNRFLSYSWDGTIRVWDILTYTQIALLEGHSDKIDGIVFLTDNRFLSYSSDNTIRIWDSSTYSQIAVLEGHSDVVRGALLLPDNHILSWSRDTTLRIWDSFTYTQCLSLEGHSGEIHGGMALPDNRILSWSADGTLRIWNNITGELLVILEGHSDSVRDAMIMPDGRILSWSWSGVAHDGNLCFWDNSNGNLQKMARGHSMGVKKVHCLPDGRLLSCSEDSTLRLWDGIDGTPIAIFEGHSAPVRDALLMPGNRILSWSDDATLRIWKITNTGVNKSEPRSINKVEGILPLSNDQVLSWSKDPDLTIWNSLNGNISTILKGHSDWVNGALVLANSRLLSWGYDNTLRIWDLSTGICKFVLKGHDDVIEGAISLPQNRIISWAVDKKIILWNGKNGVPQMVLEGHKDFIDNIMVLSGNRILSVGMAPSLHIWDLSNGTSIELLKEFALISGPINGTLVLPNDRILSWSIDDAPRIWNIKTGSLLATLGKRSWSAHDVLILPNGSILTLCYDRVLRIWSAAGDLLAMHKGHESPIDGASLFSENKIISWSKKAVRIWHEDSGVLFEEVPDNVARLKRPDLFQYEFSSNRKSGRWFLWKGIGWCILQNGNIPGFSINWHMSSSLLEIGCFCSNSIAVIMSGRHVYFLRPMFGNRRVTLKELEELAINEFSNSPKSPISGKAQSC